VIDKISEEAEEDDGQPLFRIRWYNFGPKEDIWESEDQISAPLVAAFRKTKKRQL